MASRSHSIPVANISKKPRLFAFASYAWSERGRYVRYADFHGGGEELDDHESDEEEWNNLADDPRHEKIKSRLAQWLPKKNKPDAPGVNAFRFDPKTYRWTLKK